MTIFEGQEQVPRDVEAYDHLDRHAGVPKDRIYAMGMKDNFWQMGDTGPCGPCSELHYDMGMAASDAGHTDCQFGCECGRYVEIWNLVFMQFDKQPSGELIPLPKPSIDTGAGLERVAAVLQGVISNYDTDLFVPLIRRAAELTGVSVDEEMKREDVEEQHHQAASLRVIADHARAATFLISDGVLPMNEGRGYVLRKIIRRAIRHGRLLGQEKPFLFEMVFAVRDLMKDAYPELVESTNRVVETIKGEETRFAHTLDEALKLLELDLREAVRTTLLALNDPEATGVSNTLQAQGQPTDILGMRKSQVPATGFDVAVSAGVGALRDVGKSVTYSGELAFRLYDTFGLPRDFIEDACRDQRVIFDTAGFDAAMEEQRRRARASWKGGSKQTASPAYQALAEGKDPYAGQGGVLPDAHEDYRPIFVGYKLLRHRTSVLAVFWSDPDTGIDIPRAAAIPGHIWHVVLKETPFYATAGGQVGDTGWLYSEDGNELIGTVLASDMPVAGLRVLTVRPTQPIEAGEKVVAVVDGERRTEIMRNHTGTHLLHAALREVLGTHVKQAGSLVDPGHLRFDFSHFASLGDEELQDIEDLANKEVLRNDRVEVIEDVPIDVAVNEYKAMALFGEKYGDRVRVIRIGDFSTELCGGTHTAATGEIGLIKVLKEGSVSSGVRRLEAVTGEGSLRHFRKDHQLENVVATLVRGGDDQSPAEALKHELERRDEELKKVRKELDQARMKSASSSASSATENVREVKGVKVLAHRADNLDRSQLRTLIDNLRNKLGSGVVVLGSVADDKVSLIVGVTKDLTSRVQAGKIIAEVAKKVGGSGGGRPDMAEAGGKDPAALDSALAESYDVVGSLLG